MRKFDVTAFENGTDYPATVTYKFWKTTSDGRDIYVSDSRSYGIIEITK